MFDWKDFEDMFAAKEGANLKDAGKKQLEKKPDLITVVDPKKAYNCCTISSISLSPGCLFARLQSFPPLSFTALMLGLLKMTNAEVKKAILTVDKENVLADNTVMQFLNYIPSAEEIAALKPFKDDPSKLAAADQFMMAVCFFFFFFFLLLCVAPTLSSSYL